MSEGGALIEAKLDNPLPTLELEDSGLALLTDQLKHVADPEVLEIPAQGDGHR